MPGAIVSANTTDGDGSQLSLAVNDEGGGTASQGTITSAGGASSNAGLTRSLTVMSWT